jgi:iron(III) transport system ATP-binding protein
LEKATLRTALEVNEVSNVSIKNVDKNYGDGSSNAVLDLTLEIPKSEFLCLLGPSGCGKTTTLRMIAGLESLTSGEISIDGQPVDSAETGIFIKPEKRNLGLVFQNYALWPHLTVEQNIEFGLKIKKIPKSERRSRISEVLRKLSIDKYRTRYPSELSGGQQQRVALARMMAVSPRIILLDEPLSNLDAKLRLEMRTELKRIHEELGSTFIFVTHDQWEAMTLATMIAVMNEGQLQQLGKPEDIYDRPANRFVAEFVGALPINIVELADKDDGPFGSWLSEYLLQLPVKADVVSSIGIRPENLVFFEAGTSSSNQLGPTCPATISDLVPTGGNWIVELQIQNRKIHALTSDRSGMATGEEISFSVHRDHLHLFDRQSKRVSTTQ